MKQVSWPYFDPEFDTLGERIHGPPCRVCIDNESMEDCTVVKVDSLNKQGLLLEVVQVLTDLNLIISKSYISSDAGWFMDVFHVKDEDGNKLTDQRLINQIQQAIGTSRENTEPTKTNDSCVKAALEQSSPEDHNEHTAIEMTGTDRPGLFSEISAALADLHCDILEAHAWSHNARLACIVYVSDQSTHTRIENLSRLATIEDHLTMVLRATSDVTSSSTHIGSKEAETGSSSYLVAQGTAMMNTNVERRLHQLMLSVRDFEEPCGAPETPIFGSPPPAASATGGDERCRKTMVWIGSCNEKGYSVVTIRCKDRRRLMFDTVCTLIDLQYVIFHASLGSDGAYAFQEYFIRHVDGGAMSTESEKERVIKCVEAAIERRVCEGLKLEFCADNRVGLLSDITRVLRENGLTVVRADVATQGDKAVNALYVRDISGNKIDVKTFVESVKKEMGPVVDLAVKNDNVDSCPSPRLSERHRSSFGDMLRSQIERISLNFVPTN